MLWSPCLCYIPEGFSHCVKNLCRGHTWLSHFPVISVWEITVKKNTHLNPLMTGMKQWLGYISTHFVFMISNLCARLFIHAEIALNIYIIKGRWSWCHNSITTKWAAALVEGRSGCRKHLWSIRGILGQSTGSVHRAYEALRGSVHGPDSRQGLGDPTCAQFNLSLGLYYLHN